MNPPFPTPARRRLAGFTLIELLTVIAIIAILSAILVPAVGTAMRKVKETKTRVQLSNLVEMSIQYKKEYHNWPTFAPVSLNADTPFSLKEIRPRFVQIMTGNPTQADLKYNPLKEQFATFSDSDLSPDPVSSTPIDAFGNDDLWLVFNTNLSAPNQIDPTVVNSISMTNVDGTALQLEPQQDPETPISQTCVALSPGAGLSNYDVITTWAVHPAGASSQ